MAPMELSVKLLSHGGINPVIKPHSSTSQSYLNGKDEGQKESCVLCLYLHFSEVK